MAAQGPGLPWQGPEPPQNIVMPQRIIRRIYPQWSRINPRGCPQSGGVRRTGGPDNTTFSPASTGAGPRPVSGGRGAGRRRRKRPIPPGIDVVDRNGSGTRPAAAGFPGQNGRAVLPSGASGLHQLKCTHTIAFPVSSAGGEAQAMAAHRIAFPTPRGATGGCPPDTVCGGRPRGPRGDGKSDPKGGVVARRLWCTHTKARRAPSRKPRNAVVGVQFS